MLEGVALLIRMLHSAPDDRNPTVWAWSKLIFLTPPLPSNKNKTAAAPQSSCHSTSSPAWSNLQHFMERGLRSSSRVHGRIATTVAACPGQWLHNAIQATPHCVHSPTTMSCPHLMRTHTSHHGLPMPALPLTTKPS